MKLQIEKKKLTLTNKKKGDNESYNFLKNDLLFNL